MAENTEAITTSQEAGQQVTQPTEPKTYSQEELDKLIKEAETKGFVAGKTDTNKKWEQKAAEREKVAREEAEKQAKFEKMSELEKFKTIAEEKTKAFEDLQNKIAMAEKKEETRKLLKEKELDEFFLPYLLSYSNADEILEQIDKAKDGLSALVQKAVEAKITTHTPKQSTVVKTNSVTNAERAAMGLPPL